jgi:hypothetical protein
MTGKELVPDDTLTGVVVPSLDELAARWAEADRAEGNATWAKADIALEAVETCKPGDVRDFAARVGGSLRQIYDYRLTAKAWPITARANIGYWPAFRLAAQPDRFELAASRTWTTAEARELVRSRKAITGPAAVLPKPRKEAFLTAVAQVYFSAEYLAEKSAGQPAGLSAAEWAEAVKQLKSARTMLTRYIQREDKS